MIKHGISHVQTTSVSESIALWHRQQYFAHGSNGWGVIVIAPAREARAGLAPRKPLIPFNSSGQTEASNVSLGMRMIPVSISNLSLGGNEVGDISGQNNLRISTRPAPRLGLSNMEYPRARPL
jgi:hypothetical protein